MELSRLSLNGEFVGGGSRSLEYMILLSLSQIISTPIISTNIFRTIPVFCFGAACLSIQRLAKDLLSEKRWKRTEL